MKQCRIKAGHARSVPGERIVPTSQRLHRREPDLSPQVFGVELRFQGDGAKVVARFVGHLLFSKRLSIGLPRLRLDDEHAAG